MPVTLWASNFGQGTAAVDSMGNLEDGIGPDNIWSAQRVNILKNGVLAVQNLLLNTGTFPDISGVTSQLNARWFGGLEHTSFVKTTDDVDADTLNAFSDYWRVATSHAYQRGIVIDQKNGGVPGASPYSFTYTWPTPFTQFVTVSHFVSWYHDNAGGGGSAGDEIAQGAPGWDATGYTTNHLPYFAVDGGIVFSELRISMTAMRFCVGTWGITGEHRAFCHVIAKGI
jgi:hypothetical protein